MDEQTETGQPGSGPADGPTEGDGPVGDGPTEGDGPVGDGPVEPDTE